MALFGSGAALLSWLLEIFGEYEIGVTPAAILLLISLISLVAYAWHANHTAYPLLRLTLFRVRTFRVAVAGGFITRLGGGLPFLLPLLYQLGLGLPACQSGLLMMPTAAAAMGMKLLSGPILRRYGYRQVLIVSTVTMGFTISFFSLVDAAIPMALIVVLGFSARLFQLASVYQHEFHGLCGY